MVHVAQLDIRQFHAVHPQADAQGGVDVELLQVDAAAGLVAFLDHDTVRPLRAVDLEVPQFRARWAGQAQDRARVRARPDQSGAHAIPNQLQVPARRDGQGSRDAKVPRRQMNDRVLAMKPGRLVHSSLNGLVRSSR